MKKILISALTMIFMTISANAVCSGTGCYNETITRVILSEAGDIYITTPGDENALNCIPYGGIYMTLKNDAVAKNSIYSLLLTSKTTKQKMSFRTLDGSTGCEIVFAYVE